MKKIFALVLAAVMTISLASCGDSSKKEESVVTTKQTETTNASNNLQKQSSQEPIPNDSNNSDNNISSLDLYEDAELKYLEEDDKFLIINKNNQEETRYIIDEKGNAEPLDSVTLKSKYIDYNMHDVYNNDLTNLFIKDSSSETKLFCDRTDRGTVVWILHSEETPESVKKEIIAYDENAKEIYRFDPDENGLSTIRKSVYCLYEGSGVFLFSTTEFDSLNKTAGLCCNLDKKKLFTVSGFVGDEENYSSGCAIDHKEKTIINDEGKILYSADKNPELDSRQLSKIHEGIFYNYERKTFYDINLNIVADISKHTLPYYNTEWLFDNGIFFIEVENENKTLFWGVIDNAGKVVVEYQKTDDIMYYNGHKSKNVICLSNSTDGWFLYNMKTKEKAPAPLVNTKNYSGKGVNGVNVNEICYYITNGNLYKYDYENFKEEKIDIKLKQ